jgi:hypothetical protein
MLNLMDAEVLFFDPADVGPATAELAALGFKVKIHVGMIDEGGPTVFTRITGFTELDQSAFFHWMQTIVERHGGDVSEAGYADADIDGMDPVTMSEMRANDNKRLRAIT